MWAALRAVVALCCAPALASAPNLAVVWESDEFIANMRASLTTDWELVQLTHETPAATLARATAAVGEVPLQLLGQMPALQLYQSLGYASPRTPEPTASPPLPATISFCSAAGSPQQASRVMAEWTVAAALELVFKLGRTDRQMRDCAWSDGANNSCPYYSEFGAHRSLLNTTLGIIGYGRIGSEVATLSAPMFKRIIAGDPKAAAHGSPPAPLSMWSADNLAIYREADVIALTFADVSAAPPPAAVASPDPRLFPAAHPRDGGFGRRRCLRRDATRRDGRGIRR